MPDHPTLHRAALGAKAPFAGKGVVLTALPEGHVVHVLARPGGPDLAAFLRTLADDGTHTVRVAAPGQWFIVGDRPMPHAETTDFLKRLEPQATGVDQSHGRVRIRAEGPMVEPMLAKGTAVDLALSAFAVGHCATTLIGHVSAHLTRVGETAFEIMVLRGFAESLWDDLTHMSAEFA